MVIPVLALKEYKCVTYLFQISNWFSIVVKLEKKIQKQTNNEHRLH